MAQSTDFDDDETEMTGVLQALAKMVMIAIAILLLYKVGLYFGLMPGQWLVPPGLHNGWTIVGLSLVTSVLWYRYATETQDETWDRGFYGAVLMFIFFLGTVICKLLFG